MSAESLPDTPDLTAEDMAAEDMAAIARRSVASGDYRLFCEPGKTEMSKRSCTFHTFAVWNRRRISGIIRPHAPSLSGQTWAVVVTSLVLASFLAVLSTALWSSIHERHGSMRRWDESETTPHLEPYSVALVRSVSSEPPWNTAMPAPETPLLSKGVRSERTTPENRAAVSDVANSTPLANDAPGQTARDANRLTYLDDVADPYYVHLDFPRLATPQWVGDAAVDAVVVLGIDDMNSSEPYEVYLRPILERLQAIDGRAPVSIMTNRISPDDPQLQTWLGEGLSIEVHTWDHPCPCLADGHFQKSLETYHRCVDVMGSIEGNRPVAYRMPCCDSMNSPSPRFYAEIFNRPTPANRYLTIDSSVMQVFTSNDPSLPRDAVIREDDQERFEHYLPFDSYVNRIENYPYPYLIGKTCWQFPGMVPSDWEGQHIQSPNNPETLRDMQIALDLTVLKQGVYGLVFHPHGWIRNDQIVKLIDHAVNQHGSKVLFLNFREVQERLQTHLLAGQALRDAAGGDAGVRLLDLNQDGFLDVVVGNTLKRLTRVWDPRRNLWQDTDFPLALIRSPTADSATTETTSSAPRGRFGIIDERVLLFGDTTNGLCVWEFVEGVWQEAPQWLLGLPTGEDGLQIESNGRDQGLRFRDVDGDGRCELLVSRPGRQQAWTWEGTTWSIAPYSLPPSVSIVDEWGRDAGLRFVDLDEDQTDDIVFSNGKKYGVHLARFDESWSFLGWPVTGVHGVRPHDSEVPPIVRDVPDGGPLNNGVWFSRRTLWAQNEDTSHLPDRVDRRSFEDLLGEQAAIPPPRRLSASLKSLQTRAELQIDCVAHEPLVADPIAFDWGPDGRLWVVEMGDYPSGTDGNGRPGGRVRVLEDVNGDGLYDVSKIFLEDIGFPTGVKVWRHGVLVSAAPEIFFAADLDGDGRADHKETLYRGFNEGNQQHRVNGLRWGLDNWIYLANGDSGGNIESLKSGQRVPIGGRDLRIRPDTGELVAESGMAQFGRVPDDWGNWFGCNNTYPNWHYVLSDLDLRRNPYLAAGDTRRQVSQTPGAAPVFPTSRTLPRFNDFHMSDRFTSACGLEIYRDQWLGRDFEGNSFVCEPVHNLVQREVMVPAGVSFSSHRAADESQSEFLSSTDHWFRPTMARTGPDGSLWVADMYRLVIEHPEWIPADWQARLDLRAGRGLGRIYRVYPQASGPRAVPRLDQMSAGELVDCLGHENGWIRDMAQQMLIWSPAEETREALENMAVGHEHPKARLQALATLDGLGWLTSNVLTQSLTDSHPGVRRWAIRLASQHWDTWNDLITTFSKQIRSESEPSVLLQAAIASGETTDPSAIRAVMMALKPHLEIRSIQTAIISSLQPETTSVFWEALLEDWTPGLSATEDEATSVDRALTLARVAGRQRIADSLIGYSAANGDREAILAWLRTLQPTALAVDSMPAQALDLHRRWSEAASEERSSVLQWRLSALAHLFQSLPTPTRSELLGDLAEDLQTMTEWVESKLNHVDTDESVKLALVRFTGQMSWAPTRSREVLIERLTPRESVQVQLAATQALAQFDDPEIVDAMLNHWTALGPVVRHEILDVIFQRNDWLQRLLDALDQGRIPASHLNAGRRQTLFQHRNRSIRNRANEVLGAETATPRHALVGQYAGMLPADRDVARGQAIFFKHCGVCHQIEGQGHAVGPDLVALIDKSDLNLLTAILDPNRAVEDRYQEYLALTTDGRQHRGLILAESSTAVTLLAQENRQVELLRTEIEEFASTGWSVMPEGLEKDISPQAMADLFAYLQSNVSPPKTFPGNSPAIPFVRDDGSVRLLATNARIYGPTLEFESQYRNLGFWGSISDQAAWTIEVPKAGNYEVTFDYACAPETAGNRFILQVAGQTVSGEIRGTAGWSDYRWADVGRVELSAGRHEVVIRADPSLKGFLMDLRSVILSP